MRSTFLFLNFTLLAIRKRVWTAASVFLQIVTSNPTSCHGRSYSFSQDCWSSALWTCAAAPLSEADNSTLALQELQTLTLLLLSVSRTAMLHIQHCRRMEHSTDLQYALACDSCLDQFTDGLWDKLQLWSCCWLPWPEQRRVTKPHFMTMKHLECQDCI